MKLVSFFEGLGFIENVSPSEKELKKQKKWYIEAHLLVEASTKEIIHINASSDRNIGNLLFSLMFSWIYLQHYYFLVCRIDEISPKNVSNEENF